jgi:hypothetical protein
MGITKSKMLFLIGIDSLQKKRDFSFVPTSDIVKYFSPTLGESHIRVRLTQLRKEGLLENPVRGGWRLSEKGLEEIEKSTGGAN